jgi:hypothetical protein
MKCYTKWAKFSFKTTENIEVPAEKSFSVISVISVVIIEFRFYLFGSGQTGLE